MARIFVVPLGSLKGMVEADAGLAQLTVNLGDDGPVWVNQKVELASPDGWHAYGRIAVAEVAKTDRQFIMVAVDHVELTLPAASHTGRNM